MSLKEKTSRLIVRDRLGVLAEEAGVELSEKVIINISNDVDSVFAGCETWEDSIWRLQELAPLIS